MNPVSLLELSVHERSISLLDTAMVLRLVGAAGVDVGVAVGVGVGVGVWVGVAVGVGVGLGIVLLIWTIFATEGTPFELRMNSM
jgi:hypothetical protein